MQHTKMEKEIGSNLRDARKSKMISRHLLSLMSGVPERTIRHIEDGTRSPSLVIAHRIAQALNMSVEDLYFPPHEEEWIPEYNPDEVF